MKLLLLVLPLAFELVYARPIADQTESVIIEGRANTRTPGVIPAPPRGHSLDTEAIPAPPKGKDLIAAESTPAETTSAETTSAKPIDAETTFDESIVADTTSPDTTVAGQANPHTPGAIPHPVGAVHHPVEAVSRPVSGHTLDTGAIPAPPNGHPLTAESTPAETTFYKTASTKATSVEPLDITSEVDTAPGEIATTEPDTKEEGAGTKKAGPVVVISTEPETVPGPPPVGKPA
ncbi:hypothetical protein MMC22_006329 [Lobaria immixta]|nr:hypothetical protein [Lobaria immixta]